MATVCSDACVPTGISSIWESVQSRFSIPVTGVSLIAFCLFACGGADGVEDAAGRPDMTANDGGVDATEPAETTDRPDAGQTDADDAAPAAKDSDCDGLTDAEEIATTYPGGLKTDPFVADTDGDGILDGVELGRTRSDDPSCTFAGDPDPTTQTSPVAADTDGDGLRDDVEEASCTNPLLADTDGDGIPDGVEDGNRNGVLDASELNPCDATDGALGTPAASVCTAANLRALTLVNEPAPDLQLALPAGFRDELRQPLQVAGATKGVLAWDDVKQVTAIAVTRSAVAVGSTVAEEEASIRAQAMPKATLEYARTFTTWDGNSAISARYVVADTRDLSTFTNALSQLLLPGSSGALAASAGVTGPFKVQAQYVRRSDASVMVTLAVTPATLFTSAGNEFVMADIAAGSALAHADDTNAPRCEAFAATPGKVDLLFVADDSGSMLASQQVLADAATAMAEQLTSAARDWRIAMVTTSYVATGKANSNVVRGFTRNIHQFRAWLTSFSTCSAGQCTGVSIPAGATPTSCSANTDCWIGLTGAGDEQPLESARQAINLLASPDGTETTRFRPDASVAVILLTDTRDSSTASVSEYQQYFAATGPVSNVSKNPLARLIPLHGILCPSEGATADSSTWCTAGEDPRNPRHLDVILANGGAYGSIRNAPSISTAISAITERVVASSGHRLALPPIGASMKVAVEAVENPATCPATGDLPRSRTNGFDIDATERTISLFGGCRPAQPGVTRTAVSYRSWN